jgi:hypothetical protein
LFELTGFNIFVVFFLELGNSQRKVRQRTNEGIAATRARMANKQLIPERNILIPDIMVAPLDFIA